jgi:hypothetical protein
MSMSETGPKSAAHPEVDLARLEQTLLASIKLMKRGRREMERMRRKSAHPDHPGQDQSAA